MHPPRPALGRNWVVLVLLSAGAGGSAVGRYAELRNTGQSTTASSTVVCRVPLAAPANAHGINSRYARLPLSFEANQGQFDQRVQFLARGRGYSLALAPREATLRLGSALPGDPPRPHVPRRGRDDLTARTPQLAGASLRLRLLHASATTAAIPEDRLPGKVNYFTGNDAAKWRTNVPAFGKVRYRQVYPGIDLTYYGNQQQLEYDFVVTPGADPSRIRIGIRGARKVEVDHHGDLVLRTAGGDVVQHAPVTYQERGGLRHPVRSRYVLEASSHQVGFRVGTYDRRRSLVIDPVLSYSTYLGGGSGDGGEGIAVDGAGSAYVTGFTNSTDFPTRNPLQPTSHGADLFITKLSPDGGSLVYSTYLGGSNTENVRAIAVDGDGNACVTGDTASTDFPTFHAILPTKPGGPGGTTAFVAKLNATGSTLLFSTYLGGTGFRETGYGVAADASGGTYVAGFTQSGDFPTLHAFQPQPGGGSADGFVTKFNADGTLAYSSFLGGNGSSDSAFGIAIDAAGDAYVTGQTDSTDFPTKGALQRNHSGGFYDAFVTEVNPTGTGLVYSTYLGGDATPNGGSTLGLGIAADEAGNAYVTGEADTTTFHTTPGALQPANTGSNAFVTKLGPGGGSFVYSTYFGGIGIGQCSGIAADPNGNAYVTGYTAAADFPVKNSLQPFRSGTYAFVSSFNPTGMLVYSTLVGGLTAGNETGNAIAADAAGNAYVTGSTGSDDFPTVNPVQPARKGFDAFIVKLALAGGPPPPPPATHFSVTAPATVTAGDSFGFTLTALDAANNPVPSYRGTAHFTSPDPQAVLPADYPFTAADAGAHTFSATLKTAGAQGLTGTDAAKPTLTGSAPITVTAAAPADLHFGQQPTNAAPGAAIAPPVTVKIVDAFGNTVTTANNSVTLALGANPGGGTLNGTMTVTAVNGVATFNNLSVDKPGSGYTLAPSATGLPGPFTASAPFNIAAKPATHFSVTAPASASSGTAFDVTVTALDADNHTVTGYTGTVHWTSSDPQALLPADYTFAAGDAGVRHFVVTLKTVGSKTLTLTDKSAPSITGTATVNVTEAVSFVVTTNLDTVSASDGVTSLREAILAANAHPGLDTITFKIPGSGVKTITPTTPLPTITDPVVIDGYTQPGAKVNTAAGFATNAVLLIEISGSKAGKGANGLTLTAGGSTVKGLVINRFQGNASGQNGAGIQITGAGGNTIAGCFLGTATTGKTAAGNAAGVAVQSSLGNLVGGSQPAAANLLSGNIVGISISGSLSTGNTAQGNVLGTDASGTKAISNMAGIQVSGPQNTVGPGNLLSGNLHEGVGLYSTDAVGNVVAGNRIGTDASGAKAVPNQQDGIAVATGASHTRIGGAAAAARNVISGNKRNGIYTTGAASTVVGNFLGVDVTGNKAVSNGAEGVRISGPGAVIGGATSGERNVISGNAVHGIVIEVTGTGAVVQGNLIGTNLSGSAAVPNAVGVVGDAPGCLIGGTAPGAGNVVSGNTADGVGFGTTGTGAVLQGNYIGTNATGTAALPNGAHGVGIGLGAGNELIGGTVAGARNVISGNKINGIQISDASAGNQVQGNYIGTNAAGTTALPNGASGVSLDLGSHNNLIGGTLAGSGNVISGNKVYGIFISGTSTSGNTIQGNFIGVDVTGTKALGNGGPFVTAGVEVDAPGTLIGGTDPGSRNIISGNPSFQVRAGANSTGTLIQGNYIGTNASGSAAIGGGNEAVNLVWPGSTIGGTAPGAGNVISGNAGTAVSLFSAGSQIVQGNLIGTNAAGTAALPNQIGISVFGGAKNNLIGGTVPGARNVISGNTTDGIMIAGPGTGNQIQGNFIGTDAAGASAIPNLQNGINLTAAATANLIGGTAPGARNVISGNVKYAVLMADAKSGTNTVQGNYIGTNAAGSAGIANFDGLHIFSSNNQIGGTAPGAGNVVSASTATGILFTNGAINNVTQGNRVGTDATGSFAIPNLGNGIYVRDSDKNVIGGSAVGAGNLISGNVRGLVLFSNSCLVQGNRIGTQVDGASPLPNTAMGLVVQGDGNIIGGVADGQSNTIAFNKTQGVLVDSGTRNAIRGNGVFGNDKLGIDLLPKSGGAPGVTPNDAGDKDSGANSLQNYPVLTDVSTGPGNPLIKFALNSTPNTKFVVDIYLNDAPDATGFGQGQSYNGSIPVTTDSGGDASFTIIPRNTEAGKYYTATASRDYGGGVFETSEFSNAVRIPGP